MIHKQGKFNIVLNYSIKFTVFSQFYNKTAFIRDVECVEVLKNYLRIVNQTQIMAPVNSSLLNSWTPSPLILAGLISGKIKKGNSQNSTPFNINFFQVHEIGKNNTHQDANFIEETEDFNKMEPEMGMNALDMDMDILLGESTSSRILKNNEEENNSNPVININDWSKRENDINDESEDNASLLSHPSILEEKFTPKINSKMRSPKITLIDENNAVGNSFCSSSMSNQIIGTESPQVEHTSEVDFLIFV